MAKLTTWFHKDRFYLVEARSFFDTPKVDTSFPSFPTHADAVTAAGDRYDTNYLPDAPGGYI